MVDPVSLGTIAATTLAGAGASAGVAAASGAFKKPPGTPTLPNIPAPPATSPSQSPGTKPGKKGMQQSFLSGVAGSALAPSGGSSTGKTLLGQ